MCETEVLEVRGQSRAQRRWKEVSVRPRNKVEGGRDENEIEQARLNNVKVRSEQGSVKQGEWIMDSQVSGLEIELSSRRKLWTSKRVAICYP